MNNYRQSFFRQLVASAENPEDCLSTVLPVFDALFSAAEKGEHTFAGGVSRRDGASLRQFLRREATIMVIEQNGRYLGGHHAQDPLAVFKALNRGFNAPYWTLVTEQRRAPVIDALGPLANNYATAIRRSFPGFFAKARERTLLEVPFGPMHAVAYASVLSLTNDGLPLARQILPFISLCAKALPIGPHKRRRNEWLFLVH